MAKFVTLDDVQAEAERRGYVAAANAEHIRVVKRHYAHVKHSFVWESGFVLEPPLARKYALLQAYYWIRGYDLNYGDDGKVELHRGMHHPLYDQQTRVAETFDYFFDGGIEGLHQKMLQWVEQVEQPGKEDEADHPRTRTLRIEGTPRTYFV